MNADPVHPVARGSLLDEQDASIGAGPRPKPGGRWRLALRVTPGEIVSAAGGWVRRRRRLSAALAAALLAGGGAWAWLALRIEPPPDYTTAPLDTLFEYTLLTDDFNRLPIEQRLALIRQLVERMKAITGGDSLLLAMFASMIIGEAREQLTENLSRLAIDVADDFAVDYDPNAAPEARQAFLEDAFIEMQTMFDFEGETRTREEMLAAGRRQAQRDLNRFKDGKVGAGEVIRIFDILNNEVGQHMSGHQKVRVQSMFRDMTEMLRKGP
jgi:hypothetical protein